MAGENGGFGEAYEGLGPEVKAYMKPVVTYSRDPDMLAKALRQMAGKPDEEQLEIARAFKDQYYPGFIERRFYDIESLARFFVVEPAKIFKETAEGIVGIVNDILRPKPPKLAEQPAQ